MTAQLDNNRIAIRERDILEIMSLALVVMRKMGMPLLRVFLIGALPMIFLNSLLMERDFHTKFSSIGGDISYVLDNFTEYFFFRAVLVAIEIPLATALMTLYMGQWMFQEEPKLRQVFRDFFKSLPQLLVYQVFLRGFLLGPLMFVLVGPIIPYVGYPYLNEIILLERTPLFAGRTKRITSFRRSQVLHRGIVGHSFGRWLASLVFAVPLVIAIWVSILWLIDKLGPGDVGIRVVVTVAFPIALWIVVAYFTVVRFLAYLDTRIRHEGWEVELAIRSEAAKLGGQTI